MRVPEPLETFDLDERLTLEDDPAFMALREELRESSARSEGLAEQSGKTSQEALKVGRQSRNIAIAALAVAALSLLAAVAPFVVQLLR